MAENPEAYFYVQARGTNLEYQWFKDQNPIDGSSDNGMKKYNGSEKSNELVIKNVEERDEGWYWCQIWSRDDDSNKIKSHRAELTRGKPNYLYAKFLLSLIHCIIK